MPHSLGTAGVNSATYSVQQSDSDYNLLGRQDFEGLPDGRLKRLMLKTYPDFGSSASRAQFFADCAAEGFSAVLNANTTGAVAQLSLYPIGEDTLVGSAIVIYEGLTELDRGVLRISVDYSANK